MQRLIDSSLFGMGLIPICNGEMVGRYNACLELLGIERTGLEAFNVDGLGWSPEIAAEKKDPFYLSAGPANPMAIVVGPDQRGKPVYFPYNSYDRPMMRQYFDHFAHQIADITASVFIGLDIDQELMSYKSPLDLLLVEYIVVRTIGNGMTEAAQLQKDLVSKIQGPGAGWSDAPLRRQLVESASIHGDMRFLQTEIPDMKYDRLGIFHTQAFGGTFVMRRPGLGDGFVILEHPERNALEIDGKRAYTLDDPYLVPLLMTDNVLELDLDWYAKNSHVLEEIQDYMQADLICECHPDIEYEKMNGPKKKQLRAKCPKQIPETFHELERLARKLNAGKQVSGDSLSRELRTMLLRPGAQLNADEEAVVWQLLVRWNPWNILKAYEFDKNFFFNHYRSWPNSKKGWAVSLLKKFYVPLMNR